ncbi:uncharacterized protein [Medicago truncatula]|uniref:uncharacterized protein n=1 Tax=Medicago truncatula TaxID=3880 RepID=UPI001968968C|nr:uncharacterized protein LOC120580258 [Medicago truncatula]
MMNMFFIIFFYGGCISIFWQYMLLVFFFLNFILRDEYERRSLNEKALTRYESRRDILDSIISASDSHCIWELRMCRNTFAYLCEVLRVRRGLVKLRQVTVEEQVAVFLNVLAHHTKNRSIQVRLSRSGQTISKYCHRVLAAVLKLRNDLLAKPEPVPQDCTDERWKWFKGCLGALDGTYIAVTPSASDRPRYRTRKDGTYIAVTPRGGKNTHAHGYPRVKSITGTDG